MKKVSIVIVVVAVLLLAMEIKVSINKARAETVGFPTGLRVKSANGVVWEITVDDNGILGTDSIGVTQ